MDETRRVAHEGEVNPEVQHEDSDINVRALAQFAIGFIVFAAVMHLGIWGMYRLFEKEHESRRKTPVTLVEIKAKQRPPEPILQVDPVRDMNLLIEEQKKLSGQYAADPHSASVRLPIERAMALVAQKQMPVRPPQNVQPAAQVLPPGAEATVDTTTPLPDRLPVFQPEKNTEGTPE